MVFKDGFLLGLSKNGWRIRTVVYISSGLLNTGGIWHKFNFYMADLPISSPWSLIIAAMSLNMLFISTMSRWKEKQKMTEKQQHRIQVPTLAWKCSHSRNSKSKLGLSDWLVFNPFPLNDTFWRPWETSLLKTLWEKEKLLVTSNFSFSHSVF